MKINSIVFKMITPLIVLTVLITVITLIVTQTYLKQVVEDIFIDLQVHHLEKVYTLKMDNVLSDVKCDGLSIASTPEVQEFLMSSDASNKIIPEKMKKKLAELKKIYEIQNIYVAQAGSRNYFDENGFVKVVDPSDKESAWFIKTLEGKKKFAINADSDVLGSVHVWNDVIVGSTEKPIGLAGCGIDITDIFKIALEDFKQDSANVMILSDDNVIEGSSYDNDLINKKLRNSSLPKEKVAAIELAQKSKTKLATYNLNDVNRYLLFVPIEKLHWQIVIDFSKEKFLYSLHGVYDRIITGGAILLFLLMFVGGWTFSYLVSRPLKNLANSVSNFDYTSEFASKGCKKMGYEVEMICDAFTKSSQIVKSTLEKYKNSEELLRSIMNSTDDLIFFKDLQNRYLGCNVAYENWSSHKIEEIIGKSDRDIYSNDVADLHIQVDNYVLSQNKTVTTEEKFERDGSSVTLQIKKSPFYDKEGNVMGVSVIARDISIIKTMEYGLRTLNSTLEKRVEEKTQELIKSNEALETHIASLEVLNKQLRKAKEDALQAAQARSNFISGISHELRTPLNAIINFTDQVIEDFDEMLEDKELQGDTKGFLERVIVNSKHLLQLINDLLEFTKAEAGKIDYKIEINDINEILKLAYNNTYSLLNGTDVEYRLSLCEEPVIGLVDARRFLQVVLNLLSNSIKFTEHGFVEIRSFLEANYIVVEIEDSGKGIPKEKHKNIYEPFIQANSSDSGTGLGLGLAKRMCNDMGIYISFRSIVGKGTVFSLIIKKA